MSRPREQVHLDWAAIQARDRDALEAMCRAWLPTVLQWCRRLGGPRVDADAAAQEVFMITLGRLDRIEGPQVLSAWLFGVTRRVLARQRQAAFPSRWAAEVDTEGTSDEDAGVRAIEAGRTLTEVGALIASLPEDLAQLIVLVDIEGRSTPDVLALTALPEGTMRTKLRMARHRLRSMARARGMIPEKDP